WHAQPLTSADGNAEFAGAKATLTLDNAYQDARLQVTSDGFSAQNGAVDVKIQGITLTGSVAVAADGKQMFSLLAQMANTDMRSPEGERSWSKNTRLAVSGTLDQDMLDGKFEYSVDDNGTAGVGLGSIQLAAHVDNVNVPALQTVADYMDTPHQHEDALEKALLAVLGAQPVLALDKFQWQTQQGSTA